MTVKKKLLLKQRNCAAYPVSQGPVTAPAAYRSWLDSFPASREAASRGVMCRVWPEPLLAPEGP